MGCEECEKTCEAMSILYGWERHWQVNERRQYEENRVKNISIGKLSHIKVDHSEWNTRKFLKDIEQKESQEKVSQAMSYINTLLLLIVQLPGRIVIL